MDTFTNTAKVLAKVYFLCWLILASCSCFLPSYAQNKTWSMGPEFGLSLAKYINDPGDKNLKAGLLAGGSITYSTINTFGITLKVLYHQKGTRYLVNDVMYKERLDYLELPLLGRFFLTTEGKFRPNLFMGPSFAYLLGAKNKLGEESYNTLSGEKREDLNNFDMGLTGGLGLNYLLRRENRLLFDIRYTHGLIDLSKSEETLIYNQGLAFTLGLSYGIKAKRRRHK